MFQNTVLRKMIGLRERKLRNEELQDVYCSPNIMRVIKSRRMRRVGYVAGTGKREAYRVLLSNLKENDQLKSLEIEG